MDLQNITGRRKAAALLISLGSELASQVLKTMREDEVELITREIVRMERLPAEAWARVGRHTESGSYSAERWLEIYSAHLEEHAAQIEANVAAWRSRGS